MVLYMQEVYLFLIRVIKYKVNFVGLLVLILIFVFRMLRLIVYLMKIVCYNVDMF